MQMGLGAVPSTLARPACSVGLQIFTMTRTHLHSNTGNRLHCPACAGFRDGRSFDGEVTAWDGTRWTTIREAQEGVSTLQLVGLAANQLWVARGNGVLHFNGQGWTQLVRANMPAGGAEPVSSMLRCVRQHAAALPCMPAHECFIEGPCALCPVRAGGRPGGFQGK